MLAKRTVPGPPYFPSYKVDGPGRTAATIRSSLLLDSRDSRGFCAGLARWSGSLDAIPPVGFSAIKSFVGGFQDCIGIG